jgi:hypothetical protein
VGEALKRRRRQDAEKASRNGGFWYTGNDMRIKILIASVVGMLCGFLSTRAFLIGWWNILFWGAAGIVIGFFARGRKEIMWSGLYFGFFLSLSFLFSGFQGTPDKLPVFSLFAIFLSIIGALGGWLAVFLGSKIKK